MGVRYCLECLLDVYVSQIQCVISPLLQSPHADENEGELSSYYPD